MPIHKADAIVLNRWNFRETSLIVSFYTREYGKISGILKGIRPEPAKFASTVEHFSRNSIIFYKKRSSELHLVSACDIVDNFTPIRQDISKITCASMMTELLSAVMQIDDKNEAIFELILSSLRELTELQVSADKISTIFKIKILALSGFKPHFDSCVSCGSRIMSQSKFSLVHGGLLCPGCYHRDLAGRAIFRGTIASILHIERNDLKANLKLGMNPEIKRELDLVLNSFIQFHLEKELKSQRVFNKLEMAAI